jgi:hypothetical protein
MTQKRTPAADDDWEADWESHRQWQLTSALDATPAERLAWLEEAIELAWKCGAHPASRSDPDGGDTQ